MDSQRQEEDDSDIEALKEEEKSEESKEEEEEEDDGDIEVKGEVEEDWAHQVEEEGKHSLKEEEKSEEESEDSEEESKDSEEESQESEEEEEGSKRIDRKPETAEELIGELRRRLEATGPPPPPVRVRTLVPFKIKGMTVDSIIAVHGLSEEIPERMIVTRDRKEEKKWDLPLASVCDGAPTVEILDWQ